MRGCFRPGQIAIKVHFKVIEELDVKFIVGVDYTMMLQCDVCDLKKIDY